MDALTRCDICALGPLECRRAVQLARGDAPAALRSCTGLYWPGPLSTRLTPEQWAERVAAAQRDARAAFARRAEDSDDGADITARRPPATCPCGDVFILADTEDWRVPRCYGCWEDMGSPEEEPAS